MRVTVCLCMGAFLSERSQQTAPYFAAISVFIHYSRIKPIFRKSFTLGLPWGHSG